jgi:2-amino-4-hydroxy-6-hydroxymethyldihydropteridine diphosphokinase
MRNAKGAVKHTLLSTFNIQNSTFIALGSNLGDRAGNINAAVALISATPGIRPGDLSPFMENPAVGGLPDSPPFLNAAMSVSTTLPPMALLARLLEIETEMRRVRRHRNEPRVIDLDLLLYADFVSHDASLTLPHPRLHERRFVLLPLSQIAPNLIHPTLGRTIQSLLDELPPIP